MSAYEKGLARLITRPDLVDGLTIRDRKGGLGTVTIEGGNFVVRLRTDPRPIVYPADAFGTHVLELQMVDQMRLRSALTELGKEKQSAGARALEAIASFRAASTAGATTYQPTTVVASADPFLPREAAAASTAPWREVADPSVARANEDWYRITAYSPVFETQLKAELIGIRLRKRGTASLYNVIGVIVDRDGEAYTTLKNVRSATDRLRLRADEVLEEFDVDPATVSAAFMAKAEMRRRMAEQAAAERAYARSQTYIPTREAATLPPPRAPMTAEQRKAVEAAKVGQSERFLLEQTMAARAAVPVAVTYADAINGLMFDKVPLNGPPFAGMSIAQIGAEYVKNVAAMRATYDAARRETEAIRDSGGKAKMPKFPYSILIIEMRNGERAMVDMASGGIRRDVPSEQVTQRLDVILHPPKVGPASVDTRAAQEMRADLARVGHIVEGVGGRRHYSDPLLSEVRGTAGATSHILESYDPRMEGQTRSGEQLLRFRGKSRFAKMLDATPITETSGSRAERAEGMGYGLTEEEVRDMQEAMQITAGVRLTPSSAATAFRKAIKFKDDEKPTGEIEFDEASEEYYIIGTKRSFGGSQGRERAIAFLRKVGIPADRIVIYGEDAGEGFDELP